MSQHIINTVIGYAGLFFVTRFIGSGFFGLLGFVLGFGGMFSFLADLGFSQAHQKYLNEGGDVGTYNGTFLAVKLALGLIYVAVVVIALLVWTHILHRGFEYPIEYWMILAIVPYYFFQSLLGFAKTYFTAYISPARMAIPSLAEAVLRNSIFIGLGLLFYLHISVISKYDAAILLAVAYSISYGLYFVLGVLLGRPWNISKPDRKTFRMYAALGLPLALTGSLAAINGNIDKVIIQFFWGDKATGAFFLEQRIVQSITAITAAITVFFLPMLSRITGSEHTEEFTKSIGDFERITSLFILPFIVMFIALSTYIVNIFSSAYVPYANVLGILAIAIYFNTTRNAYISALTARGKTKLIAIVSGITVGLNIILNLILVPTKIFGISYFSLGVIGAGVSSLVAAVLSNIIFKYVLYKEEGAKGEYAILKHLIPVGAQWLSISAMLLFVTPYSIFLLAPVGLVSLGVYLGVAILIKEISFNQVWTFAVSLSPVSFFRQLREER